MLTKSSNIVTQYLFRQKKQLFWIFISGFIANGAILLFPILSGRCFYLLFENFNIKSSTIQNYLPDWIQDVSSILMALAVLLVIKFTFLYIQNYESAKLAEQTKNYLRRKLFYRQLRQKYRATFKVDKQIIKYSNDFTLIYNYITTGVIRYLLDSIILLIGLGIALIINAEITLILGIIGIIFFVIVNRLNKLLTNANTRKRYRLSQLLSYTYQQFREIYSIKVFNKITPVRNEFDRRSERLLESSFSYRNWTSMINAINPVLASSILLFLFYYLYSQHQDGLYQNQSDLIAYWLLIHALLPYVLRIYQSKSAYANGNIAIDKITHVLNSDIENIRFQKPKKELKKVISIKEFPKIHEVENATVENLSISIAQGECIHLIFENNHYKQLFFNALFNISTTWSSYFYLDNINYSKIDTWYIRKQISVFSDNFPLVGKTISECIFYRPEEPHKEYYHQLVELFKTMVDQSVSLSDNPEGDIVKNKLSIDEKGLLYFIRAASTNKPFIVIDMKWSDYSSRFIEFIVACLVDKISFKGFIFLTPEIPASLQVLFQEIKYKIIK